MSTIKISGIKPNTKNPRNISPADFDRLVESIKSDPEILTVSPIVLNSTADHTLLAGEMRLRALKKLKYKTIPAEWVLFGDNLTDQQKEKFILLDNTHYGTWDIAKLTEDWGLDKLNDWKIAIPEFNLIEDEVPDLLQTGNTKTKKETSARPLATDNEYSVFELVMLHENKLKLLDVLNKIKTANSFDKLEDALMLLVGQQ